MNTGQCNEQKEGSFKFFNKKNENI